MENRTGLGDGMGGRGDETQDSPNREDNRNSKVITYYITRPNPNNTPML